MLHSKFGKTPINILQSKEKKSCPFYREFGLQCASVSLWISPGKEHHFQKLPQPQTLLSGNSHPPPMENKNVSEIYMPPMGFIFSVETKPVRSKLARGLECIKRTTPWAKKSSLTLTFEHVTWKLIGIIYTLRATPAQSLVLIKWRGQMILSGQHSGLRRVVWPWPLNMWLENQ